VTRLAYLDWLRGIAVLIMVEAHIFDAWTRVESRSHPGYTLAIGIAGYGAPLFMFLAGVALVLAAGARLSRGASVSAVAAQARRRGWQIFALAFLFRLQAWLISGGEPSRTLMKVDILNIMGLSMVAAALLWESGRSNRGRTLVFTVGAVAVVLLTPLVRATPLLAPLVDQLEWYLREDPAVTSFALFPWTAYLFGGAAAGLLLQAARTDNEQRRAVRTMAWAGMAMTISSGAALLLGVGADAPDWEDVPASFFMRFGIVLASVWAAYEWCRRFPGRSWVREFGVASLFVYWVHVEMAYGVPSLALHRRLSFEAAAASYLAFTGFLYLLVRLKDRVTPHLRQFLPQWAIAPTKVRA
jgi:uncharacterized membrane protein